MSSLRNWVVFNDIHSFYRFKKLKLKSPMKKELAAKKSRLKRLYCCGAKEILEAIRM